MIPKIIHYCWFGRGKMPDLAERCIKSWEKYCPDYEFMLWNEDNFDIMASNEYVREAYENKKYAFVTDYVRLYALTRFGGVYMDTDVELVGPLDRFLSHAAFSGFEEDGWIPTGLMACEANFPLFVEFLHYYDDISFKKLDGTLDMTTNTVIMTQIAMKYGLVCNGKFQVVNGFTLYPKEFFCPLENATGRLNKTNETVAIHWFSKSWLPAEIRYRTKITRLFHRLFGINCFSGLKQILKKK